jgi:hypothetical protein
MREAMLATWWAERAMVGRIFCLILATCEWEPGRNRTSKGSSAARSRTLHRGIFRFRRPNGGLQQDLGAGDRATSPRRDAGASVPAPPLVSPPPPCSFYVQALAPYHRPRRLPPPLPISPRVAGHYRVDERAQGPCPLGRNPVFFLSPTADTVSLRPQHFSLDFLPSLTDPAWSINRDYSQTRGIIGKLDV